MIGNATDFTNFAEARGIAVDPDMIGIYLTKASDYLDNQDWRGVALDEASGSFPRYFDQSSEAVTPASVVKAAYLLACQAAKGVDLMPVGLPARGIKQASVTGAVSVTYDDKDTDLSLQPSFPWLDKLIGKYLDNDDGSFMCVNLYRG